MSHLVVSPSLLQLSNYPIKLLILDDSAIDRQIYIRYLRSGDANYHILEADSLKKALQLWQMQKPDVVLLDLNLPDGNGLDFLENIRSDYPSGQLPVIVITGQADAREAVRAMKMGAADYQVKEDLTRDSLPGSIRKARERSRIFNEKLIRSQQRASLVAEVALRIRQSLNLDDVLTAIVQEVRQFLSTHRVLVYQFNADMSGVVVAESVEAPWISCLNAEIVDTCFRDNMGGEYREGRIFIADDIYKANLNPCHLELLEKFQVRANLVVPILLSQGSTNVLWGLLIAHHCGDVPRHWQDGDMQLLRELAVQSAIAIQQAKLYQDLQNLNSSLEAQVEERTKALTTSERKYRAIFNNAIVLTAVLDLKGTLLEVNQTALTFKGLRLEEVIGQPFWQTPWWDISGEVRNRLREQIAQTAKGESVRSEIEVLDGRGERVPVDFSLRPLRNERGEIVMLIAEGRDIRVTKQNEATLKFQAQILDQINDGVISTDLNGIICSWNRGAEKLYGYTAEETIGQNISFLYDDPREFSTQLLKPILEKNHHEIELRTRSKTGQLIYVSLRLSTVRNERGEVTWLIGCANDISQRKQAEIALRNSEAALRRSEEFNRLAVEASRIGTWDLILPANTCIMSSGMVALMDYRPRQTQVSISQWQASVITEDMPLFKAALKKTIEENVPVNVEYRIKLQDGSIRWLHSRGGLTKNEFGQPVRIRGASIDISESKQLELARQEAEIQLQQLNQELEAIVGKRTAQLQQTNEELARATRLKDEFLANMSHELRTPLNAILGLSEALLEGIIGPLNERQKKSIDTIERSGAHLLELITDILDLAKISSGKMELNLSPMPVESLCDSSLVMVKQQAFQKHITIASDIPEGLKSILVDQRQMRQVLINLLSNAIKFTLPGGQVSLKVGVVGGATGRGSVSIPDSVNRQYSSLIVFQVTDTGIGIAPEDIEKLFDPFVQIDSSLNRQQNGTGLGLALVKRITELHGGKIVVESQPERGSTFTVVLPYNNPAPHSVNLPLEKVKTSSAYNREKSPNCPVILLAEDNEANIVTFSNYLIAQKYKLVIARNGLEAVALTHSQQPDLILMDLQMPEMDGFEAIKTIRADERFHRIPIIALSALAMPSDREKCLANGANEYLSKPVRLRKLIEAIEQIFEAGK
ncbi:MAG: Sensor histidine kinase RcsC [Chroococcopsis gigantea SAG 12.99]|jgi:PAS domain S-box-containing protein|nr:response regulator [Chlorogloea purpurea SAG 13.99]MDV3001772.1 Sensor histidine kinase RcsC [Chroococcopsis gigantea SAG 12.99]